MKSIFQYITAFILSVVFINNIFSQMVEKSNSGPFLLKNGTVHTITNGVMKADVLIQGDKIIDITTSISNTINATVIDCTGKHIYPGMIDGGTQLGLAEIESISLTNDFREIGEFNAHMDALTAVNPNSVSIPVTRTNGITTVLASPTGGRFSGTAALIDLHGYTPQQMYAGFKGVVLNFPSSGRRGRRESRSDEDIKKEAEKALKTLNEYWQEAILYAKIDSAAMADKKNHGIYNPSIMALKDVVTGKQTLLIEVNKEEDIKAALKWIENKKIKVVLTGVAEGYRVAKEIAAAKIPVIAGPILSLPRREYDKYDAPYTNVSTLIKAGVKVAIKTDEAENVRNLPFHAGFAATYGLGIDEAYKCISLTAAEIFGVADKYGSIEKGKIANLFISDGDPFETKTQIEKLFIRGWQVPIESRQTLLYDEFLERSPGVK
jgi:imidazolonepropionase-like amidohydrolase